MKNVILVCILIVFSMSLKSQEYKDYIIKLNGDTIKCKITSINEKYIYFKYLDLNNGEMKTQIDLKEVKRYNNYYDSKGVHNVNISKSGKIFMLNDSTFNILYNRIENINDNMLLSHNEFRRGTETIVSGLFCSFISSIVLIYDPTINSGTSSTTNQTYINPVPVVGFTIGTILMIIGEIIQIDSHKYFKWGYNPASKSYKRH